MLKMCRCCLLETETAISMYSKDKNETEYIVKIKKCVNSLFPVSFTMPEDICLNCCTKLEISYEFILQCESSQKILEKQSNIFNRSKKIELTDYHYNMDNIVSDVDDELLEPEKNQVFSMKPLNISNKQKVNKKKKTSNQIQCTICGLMKNSKSAMIIHLRTHTGEKPYTCDHCTVAYPSKGRLKVHIQTSHNERERKYICETCGQGFYRRNEIIVHLRRHSGIKPFVCSICSKGFIQKSELDRHKHFHDGSKPYKCNKCHKDFSTKQTLKKHYNVHTNDKNYRCHLCSKVLCTYDSLNVHLKLHMNLESEHICKYCNTSFSSKGNLKKHLIKMHSSKAGHCVICSKQFSNLKEHLTMHSGEKTHECQYCQKQFIRKQSLQNHIIFKHNPGTYKCSYENCLKMFPTESMLNFHHLKNHSNLTPHVCNQCARSFFRKSDLSRHLRISHMITQN